MAGFELFGPTYQLLTTSLRVRSARHSLLSANIANVDTPGYKARDVDFAGLLRSMVQQGQGSRRSDEPITFLSTNPQHYQQNQLTFIERTPESDDMDRNGVELESEVTRMVENSLHHETSLALLARRLNGLRFVISEGRR